MISQSSSRNIMLRLAAGIISSLVFAATTVTAPAYALETIVRTKTVQSGKHYTVKAVTLSSGTVLEQATINGPPKPPVGFEVQRQSVSLPTAETASASSSLTVPTYSWVFGCSAVSGAMIAGYYDRNGYPNIYTGPTESGVMPLTNASWPTWSDGVDLYPNNPLIASKDGVDGRSSKGSIDDYWVEYDSSTSDPYITGSWTQHTWGTAIGDYMKTSQSAYGNTDGSTKFYNYSDATQLTCSAMASGGYDDGTLGRKLFYEARGYTVTDCYNKKTDNAVTGGFSFSQFKSEIDAGHPVLLNLAGHSIVGVGYDESTNPATIYIHDTWDYNTHTMPWGGSYTDMALQSVSIVNLAVPFTGSALLTVSKTGNGTVISSPAGISCGGTCSYTFGTPQTVVLTATADSGSIFTGWSGGGCSGTGTCTVTLSNDTAVTATFALATTLFSENFDGVTSPALPTGWASSIVTTSGAWATNTGTVHPSGIAAHSPSKLVYFNSFTVASGYAAALASPAFSLADSSSNTASFWMYRDSTEYTDEGVTNDDRVEVYVNTAANLSGATLLGTVNRLTSLSPTVANAGWYSYSFAIPGTFTGTTNHLIFKGISGYGNDIHIDDISIVGVASNKTLTVLFPGTGSGSIISTSGPNPALNCSAPPCSASLASGTAVTLQRSSTSLGSTFAGWSGCDSQSGDNCSLTMTADKTANATFTLLQYLKNMESGNYYGTLQSALDAADPGQTIRALAIQMLDPAGVNFNTLTSSVIVKGGFSTLSDISPTGYTSVTGPFQVSSGSLTVENLIIK
ncbi:hypothetical protein SAMN02745119_01915 [Trichlorobacter thiogenes]|uniref:Peptidase C39-like domain-containing protein n=1 Tax=Trichlorobacter thiogenes TaxID=115783 RepID=A0A1T4PBA5_9BACT|nr:C39 family peptidase [Trichlorobacter thiogenes]SJZ88804.1 hypothetical protein SAMN02745119_01915 [Trichlorobacter thiogenes]